MTESTATAPDWELWCDAAQYSKYSKDPAFPSLLALARVVNALRYHAVVLLACENDPTPSGTRQRLTSFLYTAATLYEALLLVQRLGKVFRGVPAFDNRLALIFKDPVVRELQEHILPRFRNQVVFHFQESTFKEALPILEKAPRHVFAAGRGWRNADVHYGLADLLVFHHAVHNPADESDFAERFKDMLQKVTAVVLRLGDDADHLVTDRVAAMGWRRSVGVA